MSWLVANIKDSEIEFGTVQANGVLSDVRMFDRRQSANLLDACRHYDALRGSPFRLRYAYLANASEEDIYSLEQHGDRTTTTGTSQRRPTFQRIKVIEAAVAVARWLPFAPYEHAVSIGGGRGDPEKPAWAVLIDDTFHCAALYKSDSAYAALESSAGGNLIPATDFIQQEALKLIAQEYDIATVEKILSSQGLMLIHDALSKLGHTYEHIPLTPLEIIGGAGTKCLICNETIEIFISFLALFSANLALQTCSTGGVHLFGSLANKLSPWIASPSFRDRFVGDGKMAKLLSGIPTSVSVRHDTVLRALAHLTIASF